MIDVQVIDNGEGIQGFIDKRSLSVCVHQDEIKALWAVERYKPIVVVLHYGLRERGTAEYIALLNAASPGTKIIFIAPELADHEVIDCLVSGAQGYLRNADLSKLINKAIKSVRRGEAWISRRLSAVILEKLRNNADESISMIPGFM